MANSGWTEATKNKPCPICEKDHYCTVKGNVACCMRVKSDHAMRNGGYMHKLTDSLATAERVEWIERPKVRRLTDSELHARFAPLCCEWRASAERIGELASLLGVSAVALERLGVGWDGSAWTVPERNHLGEIIGINRRFPDGKKICLHGSRRGLTYATDWFKAFGPIFVVEGASDVAAGVTLGLCVVGRPSNTGGVDYLAKLLREHDRRVMILAERDAKDRAALPPSHDPDHDLSPFDCCGQCWPGKFGALATAEQLMDRLKKLIDWSFLPDGKDLRAFLNSKGANPLNESAMRRISTSLIARTRNVIHV